MISIRSFLRVIVILAAFWMLPAYAQAATISGEVTNTTGDAISDVIVSACLYYSEEVHGETYDYCTTWFATRTSSDGTYSLPVSYAGTYKVEFRTEVAGAYLNQYYSGKSSLAEANAITVTADGTAENIDVVLANAGTIAGAVTDMTGDAIPNIRVYANLEIAETWEAEPYVDWYSVASASVSPDGTYAIRGLDPGKTYRIGFKDFAGNFAGAFYDNQSSVFEAEDLTVDAASTTGGIDAVLADAGKISGRVTNTTGDALQEISVIAFREITEEWEGDSYSHWKVEKWETTGEDGRYLISGLDSREYRIGFFDGFELTESSAPYGGWLSNGYYLPRFSGGVFGLADADGILAIAGETITDVDAVMSDPGTISGRVTDTTGDALAGIEVRTYREVTSDLEKNPEGSWEQVAESLTGADGTYAAAIREPGAHKIGFYDLGGNFLHEFFANESNLPGADEINVTAGSTVPRVNAVLSDAGKISGRITNLTGDAVASADVIAFMEVTENVDGRTFTSWVEAGSDNSGTDGTYTVGDLDSGTYRIGYFPAQGYLDEYNSDKVTVEQADDLAVAAGAVTPNIDAVLSDAGAISGRVTNITGDSLADVRVEIYRAESEDTGGVSYDVWAEAGTVDSGEDGTYAVSGLDSGDYRVCFDPANAIWGGRYPFQCYDSEFSVDESTPVAVTVGTYTSGINGVLFDQGKISGQLTDTTGDGLVNIRVTAYRETTVDSAEGIRTVWDEVSMTRSRSDGSYTVGGLGAGEHKLCFFRDYLSYLYECYGDQPNPALADGITASSGATVSGVDATLAPLAADAFEADNTSGDASSVTVNGAAQNHSIHADGDRDWMTFNAVAGRHYRVETSNLSNKMDTYLALYSAGGDLIQSDDDGAGGLASKIEFSVTADCAVYLTARHFSGEQLGSYDIAVTSDNPDGQAPSTTLTTESPRGSGWYTSTPALALYSNEPGVRKYQWNGTGDAGWNSFSSEITPGSGVNELYYLSADTSGNTEDVKSRTFKVDTIDPTDPVLASPSHSEGEPSDNPVVQITWSGAADATSGVDGFSFSWSEGATEEPDAGIDVDENVAAATSDSLSDGDWYFNLRTKDNAGNWTNTQHFGPIVIDTGMAGPLAGFTPSEPTGSSGWYKTTPTVTITPDGSGETYYQWNSTSDSGWIPYAGSFSAINGSSTLYYFSGVPVAGMRAAGGPQAIGGGATTGGAIVDDGALVGGPVAAMGATAFASAPPIKSVAVKVDSGKPSASFSSSAKASGSYVKGKITVWAGAKDNVSGVQKVALYDGATLKKYDTAAPYSPSLDTTVLADGKHTIGVRVYDIAGNSSRVDRTYYVDNYRPRTSAPYGVSVKRGTEAKLYFKTRDPSSPSARVTIRIKNSAGKVVRTLYPGWKKTGTLTYTTYTPWLARGTYYFYVYADDKALGAQYNVARNKFVVR